jgi:hypothetical protein
MRGHGRKLVKTTNNLRTRGRRSSGKNSRNFHTLGYAISDREIFKVFFIPLKFFFMPLYIHFIPCENCFGFLLCFHFTPSTSISYPEHGISYQVAKFLYPTQPISYSSHFPLISWPDSLYVYIHLQLKELVMFADASYDQIMLLSLHPPPRDGCDRHRLHPQQMACVGGVGVRHPGIYNEDDYKRFRGVQIACSMSSAAAGVVTLVTCASSKSCVKNDAIDLWRSELCIKRNTLCMCIYTMSIHLIYLVSDLEGSDNGDPFHGIIN